jgi:TolA-binding protein
MHVPANARPSLVETAEGRSGGDGDKETLEALDAIKETNQEIHDQKSKIAEMESRLTALDEQIKAKKQEEDETKKAQDTAMEVQAEHHDKFVEKAGEALENMSSGMKKSASNGLSLLPICVVFVSFLVR